MFQKLVYILFLTVLGSSNALKILVIYPTPSYSHQIIQQSVSKALAARGHEVTIISPYTFETHDKNTHQIDASFLDRALDVEEMFLGKNGIEILLELTSVLSVAFSKIFDLEPVTEIIQNRPHFDAVIVENYGATLFHALAAHLNSTLIGLLSMESVAHGIVGNPTHPVLHPFNIWHVPNNPTFFDRLIAVYLQFSYEIIMKSRFEQKFRVKISEYFPELKLTDEELRQKLDFFIDSAHPVLGFTRPLLPCSIQTGFLHIQEPKPVPQELEAFMNQYPAGIVYVSFGSNVKPSKISPTILSTIISIFGKLPYGVLWKFDDDSLKDVQKNVKLIKWGPQQDILAHKNVKLFITQGGQQSREEAVDRVVPMLVIPFFGDQKQNAEQIEAVGIGKQLQLESLTEHTLSSLIHEIINNPKYKEQVQEIKRLAYDSPMKPLDTVVWWIEYAIRNRGAKHLKYKRTKVPFYQYYLLDIIAFHFFVILFLVWGLKKLFKTIFGWVTKSHNNQTKVKKN